MEKINNISFVRILLVIIALLITSGGSYMYLKNNNGQASPTKSVNYEINSTLDNKINLSSLPSEFVGRWITGGNDFLYAEFDLLNDGKFKEKSYFISSGEDVFNAEGSWELTSKDGSRYLLITYNRNIHITTDIKMIEHYRKWGQEFIGTNQILLKIATGQYGTYFRYQGTLMEKSVNISE